mgnify:FL=1
MIDMHIVEISEPERVTVGKLVLLPNWETNGVKVKIYTNTSFGKSEE